MRRFIIRAIEFALLVVLTIGGFCAIELAMEIRSYRREVVAPEGATVFVCGDSRTELGLDPGHWPEFFNFSASGRTMDQTYLTALDILEANAGRLRTMIIDISWEEMNVDYRCPVEAMGFPSQYYLLYLLHPREKLRSLSGLPGLVRSVMLEKRRKLLSRVVRRKRKFRSSLASGYRPMFQCHRLERPDLFAESLRSLRDGCFDPQGEVRVNPRYFELLDRVVDLARSRGVEVALITAPWHGELRDAVGTENIHRFAEWTNRYAREKGCRYLNLMEMGFPEECWRDAGHLNAKGAALFTSTVRDWVRENR